MQAVHVHGKPVTSNYQVQYITTLVLASTSIFQVEDDTTGKEKKVTSGQPDERLIRRKTNTRIQDWEVDMYHKRQAHIINLAYRESPGKALRQLLVHVEPIFCAHMENMPCSAKSMGSLA
jgi:hypothetical protein